MIFPRRTLKYSRIALAPLVTNLCSCLGESKTGYMKQYILVLNICFIFHSLSFLKCFSPANTIVSSLHYEFIIFIKLTFWIHYIFLIYILNLWSLSNLHFEFMIFIKLYILNLLPLLNLHFELIFLN